jgi:two-component system, cell cycle sensor histidine kinase and response regulator CckA
VASIHDRKTILLAEDEEYFRTPVLAMLQKSGYDVIVAEDGQAALEKSRQFEGTIHLLFSDVKMPNMTGVELATQLQIERPSIHILLMSGMRQILLLKEGWQFLPKPFTGDRLRETVHNILRDGPADETPTSET